MKVYLKTFLTPSFLVYDSESKASGFLAEFLEPQVTVYDDSGRLLWVYGNLEQQSLFPWVVLGVFAAIFFYFYRK